MAESQQRYATSADLPGEFASVDAATVALWLGIAEEQIGLVAWGEVALRGHVLLTSHLLKMAGEGTSAATGTGAVKSKRIGPVSVTYMGASPASSSAAEADLGSTTYGQAFRDLRRTLSTPRVLRTSTPIPIQ